MSYVDRVLQPGETIRYRGTVHWVVYLPAIFPVLLGAGAAIVVFTHTNDRNLTGAIAVFAFVVAFLTWREPMRLVQSPLEFRNCITAR
jgi:uncharacterized membrane protein YfcA